MSRKNRSIANFDDVANVNNNDIVNDTDNKYINGNDIDNNVENNNESVIENKNNNNIEKEIDNVNDYVNNENDNNKDYLDRLIAGKGTKKKEVKSVLTGIYLDPDIATILDRLTKKEGRGAKSRLVNEILKKAFSEKGLM